MSDESNAAAGAEILAEHKKENTEKGARLDRFATWLPGMRLDGSRLLIATTTGEHLVGLVTSGVLNGEEA